ncbi:C2H2-type zinc finger protein [Pyrococcus kukulkanii]|uniref:C2H2-type zinc finger protein n=1 Tax=Pyrococcus kukulkanii TaxID=1609559 RepID=A0ABV4T5Y8_9EURY
MIRCKLCGKEFENVKEFARHLEEEHNATNIQDRPVKYILSLGELEGLEKLVLKRLGIGYTEEKGTPKITVDGTEAYIIGAELEFSTITLRVFFREGTKFKDMGKVIDYLRTTGDFFVDRIEYTSAPQLGWGYSWVLKIGIYGTIA